MPEPTSPQGSEISRREFVATTALAGAALAAPGVARSLDVCGDAALQEAPGAAGGQAALHVDVSFSVNNKDVQLKVDPRATLLDALREHAGLTGTKKGCDHGQCGACTVLLDGRRVNSCLCLAQQASGSKVTTIEGLAMGDTLHPVQQAFIKHDAFQCGYCTPGQICSAVGLIQEGRCKTDADIREQMSGNLCRCGAYVNILAAVKEAIGSGV